MNHKVRGALIGLVLLGTAACNPLGGGDEAAPEVPEITASSSPSSENRAPDKPAAAGGVPKDVEVQDNDGKLKFVPAADGEDITDGDTRDNELLPALQQLLPNCGIFVNWQDVVNCVNKQKAPHDAKWYIKGWNERTDLTHGVTWDDLIKMAKAPVPKDVEVRVIQVYGWTEKEKSKAEARKAVAPLVGKEAASKMEVLYYSVDAFANTWRADGDKPAMETFADYNRQIRVTLAPLVLNQDGSVKGLLEGVPWGVFVDCYNIHGFFALVPKSPGAPLLCPPGTPNAGKPMGKGCYPGQPPCKAKCSPPPCTYKCKPPEKCDDHSSKPCSKWGQTGSIAAGNHDPDGGRPGPNNPTEPTAQDDRPVVNNPDKPSTGTGGGTGTPPVVTPGPITDPDPVDPGTQPPNNGTVPADPPPGGSCNPEFQDC